MGFVSWFGGWICFLRSDTHDGHCCKIINNPTIDQEKKGDLRGVYVYKFKIKTNEYLLAYRFIGDSLELIMIGPHENYYRDLKTYLKSRK